MCGICVGYVWDMCGICVGYVWDICSVCVRSVGHMCCAGEMLLMKRFSPRCSIALLLIGFPTIR